MKFLAYRIRCNIFYAFCDDSSGASIAFRHHPGATHIGNKTYNINTIRTEPRHHRIRLITMAYALLIYQLFKQCVIAVMTNPIFGKSAIG